MLISSAEDGRGEEPSRSGHSGADVHTEKWHGQSFDVVHWIHRLSFTFRLLLFCFSVLILGALCLWTQQKWQWTKTVVVKAQQRLWFMLLVPRLVKEVMYHGKQEIESALISNARVPAERRELWFSSSSSSSYYCCCRAKGCAGFFLLSFRWKLFNHCGWNRQPGAVLNYIKK